MAAEQLELGTDPKALPFLKWVGGKRKLVPTIRALMPTKYNRYMEPFVGGGALFFDVAPDAERHGAAYLGDINEELLTAYYGVQHHTDTVLELLYEHQQRHIQLGKTYFKEMRAHPWSVEGPDFVAARTIYLNKTCFTPGAMVLTDAEEYVPIEEVRGGQRLWSGNVVEQTLKQWYSGKIVRIHGSGVPFTLSVTADHPVMAIPGRPVGARSDKRTAEQMLSEMKLTPAGELRVNDYLLTPRQSAHVEPVPWRAMWDSITVATQAKDIKFKIGNEEAFARLIGYYAAQGHIIRQYGTASGIGLCFNSSKTEHIQDAVDTLRSVFPGVHVQVDDFSQRGEGQKVQVAVTSVKVGRFMELLVPGQSWATKPSRRRSKRLSVALMVAAPRLQLEILKGWLRGDGHCRVRGNRAELVGTCSVLPLARQLYRMAQRCDLRPSWRLYWPGGNEMAVVSFCNLSEVQKLGFATDVPIARVSPHRKVVGDYVATRIRDVVALEYEGFVHNLEVSNDKLLCVDGVVSHNCFNGLYRVNKKGVFNTPMGRYDAPRIWDPVGVRACASVLKRAAAEYHVGNYQSIYNKAEKGDFVYFDPPYDGVSATANFTGYDKEGFGEEQQTKLAELFQELTDDGVYCMLSNSDTPLIRKLYADHPIRVVSRPGSVSSNPKKRAPVNELLIRGWAW